jgi:hypothetical protein
LQNQQTEDQLKLAEDAANNNAFARKKVNVLIEPVIRYQTNRFCKRYCRENKYRYRCSLIPPLSGARNNSAMCEWGNGSYGWMLDDLTKSQRLQKYQQKNGASLFSYLYQIANSLPFYERWKDWRFGRKVHVPTYIQDLGPLATKVFLALRANEDINQIAQKLVQEKTAIESLCHEIIILLTDRNKLHLLNPPATISLTDSATNEQTGASSQIDVASFDEPIELHEEKLQLQQVWKQLSTIEQFVLEALLIEEQDAKHVLKALGTMNVSIKKDVPADKTTIQQLYYFRRKALAKLSDLLNKF